MKVSRRAQQACALAIEKLGGRPKAAKRVRRHYSAVQQWKQVPRDLVLKIEALTGIPRSELRPDIYPPDGR